MFRGAFLWRSNSIEELEQALDKAQSVILGALEDKDFETGLSVAKLMLRTRAARAHRWSWRVELKRVVPRSGKVAKVRIRPFGDRDATVGMRK